MVANWTSNVTVRSEEESFLSSWKWPITAEVGAKIFGYSSVLFLSVLGNTLIVLVAKRNSGGRMRTTSNCFLVSLCVSNMFLTVCFVPGIIKEFSIGYDSWPAGGTFGLVLCKLDVFTGNLAMSMSFLTTVAASFNWFFAVFFPWKKHWRKRVFYILFSLVWVSSIGYASPVIYMADLVEIHGILFCRLFRLKLSGWQTTRVVLLGVTPLLVVISINTAIILKLKMRRRPGNQTTHQRRSNRVTEKAFRMLLVVIVVFYVCFFPYWLGTFDHLFFKTPTVSGSKKFAIAAIFFAYFNGAITPWMLFVFNNNYSAELRDLLCCKKSRTIPNLLGQVSRKGKRTAKVTDSGDASFNTNQVETTL